MKQNNRALLKMTQENKKIIKLSYSMYKMTISYLKRETYHHSSILDCPILKLSKTVAHSIKYLIKVKPSLNLLLYCNSFATFPYFLGLHGRLLTP